MGSVASARYLEENVEVLANETMLQVEASDQAMLPQLRKHVQQIIKTNAVKLRTKLLDCLEDNDPVSVSFQQMMDTRPDESSDVRALWLRLIEYYRPQRGEEAVPLKTKFGNYTSGNHPYGGDLEVHITEIQKLVHQIYLATGKAVEDIDKYTALIAPINLQQNPELAGAIQMLNSWPTQPTFDEAVKALRKAVTSHKTNIVATNQKSENNQRTFKFCKWSKKAVQKKKIF